MKKRIGILFILAILFFVPLILAQEFNPYSQNTYSSPFSIFSGDFSLTGIAYSDWFSGFIMFLFFFVVYSFLLRKFFKEVAVVLATILAIASSLGILVLYGPIIPKLGLWVLAVLSLAIIFGLFKDIRKYGKNLTITFLIIAVLWFALGRQFLCGQVWMPYQACPMIDTICALIVIIAILYGLWYALWGRRQNIQPNQPRSNQPQQQNEHTLYIAINGNGTTTPGQGQYDYPQNRRITIRANPGNNSRFDHWELNGNNAGNNPTLNIIMNRNHDVTAIFTGRTSPTNAPRIRLFATPNTINAGQTSQLAWATINATRVDISGGVGRQGPKGRYPVRPNSTTTYTATAYGPGGTATQNITVNVNGRRGGIQNKRTIYDLQQKYRDYYMRIWNRGLSNQQRQRILQALTVIQNDLTRLGANRPPGASMSPPDIYRRLRSQNLI